MVAINADEGEPGTFKDRYCFETDPHRVLEYSYRRVGRRSEAAYIYLRDEYPQCRDSPYEIARLEAEYDRWNFTSFKTRSGSYICGEESAMLESIEGKRGLPRNRPPFPAQEGLFKRPTLINNVETMFWLRDIVANGPGWYEEQGRPHFYSVSGRVNEPGVKLAPAGVTVHELIENFCGGMQTATPLKLTCQAAPSGFTCERGMPLVLGAG